MWRINSTCPTTKSTSPELSDLNLFVSWKFFFFLENLRSQWVKQKFKAVAILVAYPWKLIKVIRCRLCIKKSIFFTKSILFFFKKDGCVVTLVHNDSDVDDDESLLLWKQLCYVAHMELHVQGLSSGYCKDVHGQVRSSIMDIARKQVPCIILAYFSNASNRLARKTN